MSLHSKCVITRGDGQIAISNKIEWPDCQFKGIHSKRSLTIVLCFCHNPNSTITQLNLTTKAGFDTKTAAPPLPTTGNSMSVISQLLWTQFWSNSKGRFLGLITITTIQYLTQQQKQLHFIYYWPNNNNN